MAQNENLTVPSESMTELYKIIKEFNSIDEYPNVQDSLLTMFFELIKTEFFACLNLNDKEDIILHFEFTYKLIKDVSKFK